MSDKQQPEVPEEGSVQFMQEILREKAVASVVMGESGNVVVQYCDSITVYSRDNSADLAAKLLSIIAETQKG
ncbi:TPA: hypothetical protein NG658_003651 [Vibrio parahaemolyticus]|uniref:hypothetical protein n=1 Tax=Vibrio TaxID=662 RepID=UPI00044E7837|nr:MULTISPECIES: hypothetical protein [Vibrio]KIT55922.1 hypothetical protein H334_19205 [Vibrio parahaemolyticus 901128]MDW2296772.1 hypothetical protein [Vibrio sp. 1404]EGQ8219723.1 hypothetical protein [Vibrio parahaemolyticus]EGR1363345.1 hypothetical protein [Vibrio parahaemolyticus]EGR3176492.1 hypothetical protein [Vibrio parahaemolyticus]